MRLFPQRILPRAIVCLAVLTLAAPPARAVKFLHKSLADWRSDLESRDSATRRSAAFALGQLGNMAAFAMDDLATCLRKDHDPAVREMAARAIGDIVMRLRMASPRPQWEVAGEALLEALEKDRSPRVRRAAAYALGAFGDLASSTAPALRKALRDPDAPASVKQNAAWALGRIITEVDNGTLNDIGRLLNDPSALVRRDAAGALGHLGQRLPREKLRPAAALILASLKEERDDVVLKTALGAMASLVDQTHREQARELYPLLSSKDPEIARGAAFVLANVGGDPALRALPVLQVALRDPDTKVQAMTTACLANAGGAAAAATEDLVRLLNESPDVTVRRNSAIALGRIGDDVRHAGRDGPKERDLIEEVAKLAVPALVEALKRMPDAAASPEERKAGEEIRVYAAESLYKIGFPFNKSAFPAIRDLIRKDANQNVRLSCVWSLFGCDKEQLDESGMTEVLEGVLAETAEPSLMVRYDAARVLAYGLREKASDRTAEILLDMITNPRLGVHYGSGVAIEGVLSEGGGATSRATTSRGADGRYMAAMAMGWLGGKAKKNAKIIEALKKAEKDPEPTLQKWAKTSLQEIDKSKE